MVETAQLDAERAEKDILDLWNRLNTPQNKNPDTVWETHYKSNGNYDTLVFQVNEQTRLLTETHAKHLVDDAYSDYPDIALPTWTTKTKEGKQENLLVFRHPDPKVTQTIKEKVLAHRKKAAKDAGDDPEEVKEFSKAIAEHATWLNMQMEKNLELTNDIIFEKMFTYTGEAVAEHQAIFKKYVLGQMQTEIIQNVPPASNMELFGKVIALTSSDSTQVLPLTTNADDLIAYANKVIEDFNHSAKEKNLDFSLSLTGKSVVQPEEEVAREALNLIQVTKIYKAAALASNQVIQQAPQPFQRRNAAYQPAKLQENNTDQNVNAEIAYAQNIFASIPPALTASVVFKDDKGNIAWRFGVNAPDNAIREALELLGESFAADFSLQGETPPIITTNDSGLLVFKHVNGDALSPEEAQNLKTFLEKNIDNMCRGKITDAMRDSLAATLTLEDVKFEYQDCQPTEIGGPIGPNNTTTPLTCTR